MNMKEYNIYYNIIIISVITFISFLLNNQDINDKISDNINILIKKFSFNFYKYNIIILEGKRCLKVSTHITKTDQLFSNRFEAFWYFISNNNLKNKSIFSLKEYPCSSNIYDDFGDPKKGKYKRSYYGDSYDENDNYDKNDSNDEIKSYEKDIFIVEQDNYFKITDKIFCKVNKTFDRTDEKNNLKDMENIIIKIYSYELSLQEIVEFLDKLENDYRLMLENERKHKKFIYMLVGNDNDENKSYRSNSIDNSWEECEFTSSRKFDNLFFDNKNILLDKINFFNNNKSFYDYEGHPYTFGLGLYGPPGTGKTSVIKCIANKLNRHIIIIPLSKIKTQREFSRYYFEQYYSRINNKKIGFDKKIIVFEDIDCMSDIVKKRNIVQENGSNNNLENENGSDENINLEKTLNLQNKLLNKIAKKVDEDHEESMFVNFNKNNNDKITLSFILNVIDGIRETPGRILIITSNDYDSLDPALIRPGRIDLTLEMKNATVEVIKQMYYHFYKDILPEEVETSIYDHKISPAKLVNMRLSSQTKEDFLKLLIKEFE